MARDDRLLRVEAVVDEVGHQLHVPLHLTVAAGRVADVHELAVAIGDDPRVEGVQRLAPGPHLVRMAVDQVGAAAEPVVQHDARARAR